MQAVEQLVQAVTAKAMFEQATGPDTAKLTFTYDSGLYEPWRVVSPLLPPEANCFGETLEEAAQHALDALRS